MSGRYPARIGLQHSVITNGDQSLPLDEVTLADKLQAVGYNTVGVGKWHLGMYCNAATPTRRGFNHWFGYYNGAEDYWDHTLGGYLDLHDDEVVDFSYNGTYGMDMFRDHAVMRIQQHASEQTPDTPLFLYLPFQSTHSPLQALERHTAAEPCASLSNADRKSFCGLAMSADEMIGEISQLMDSTFPDDDTVFIISGDNGGQSSEAGNNCPEYGNGGVCLRGSKGSLYEGGVRNHALLCSKTLVPDAMKGSWYDGLVHVTDWHATLRDLGGAADVASKPVDGMNVFEAVTSNIDSPRSEFLLNIDPCSGHGSCTGRDTAFRFKGCVGSSCGDWKYHEVASTTGWVPLPDKYVCSGKSGCEAPSAFSGQGSPKAFSGVAEDELFDLSSDPNEEHNIAAAYPEVAAELKARIAAIEGGDDYLEPCNVPGGSCSTANPNAAIVFAERNAWYPWAADPASAVV